MNKKVIGFIVCMLMITATSLTATGVDGLKNVSKEKHESNNSMPLKGSSGFDEWPMVNHDLQHTGNSTSTAPDSNELLWTFQAGNEISSSPSIVDDKLYVGASHDKIYCLNAHTGELIWDYSLGNFQVRSSPAVADGKVYVGLERQNDDVLCFDADSGDVLWNFSAGASVESSPAVYNGGVYIGSRSKALYCIDADTGNEAWKFETGDDITSSPAIYENKVYFGSFDDNFYCLNATTGDLIWTYGATSNIVFDPAIYNDKVYTVDYDYIYCIDADTGNLEWSKILAGYPKRDISAAYGNIYFSENIDHWLYCLEAETGDIVWDRQFEDGANKPAIADEKLFVLVNDTFYCLDCFTGDTIWEYPVTGGWQSGGDPCICYGRVYIADEVGKLYCFGSPSPPETPSKPDGPMNGIIGCNYTFTSSTTDPDEDDVYYMFDWDDGNFSDWLGPYPSGESIEGIYTWLEPGKYHIRVKARDVYYYESTWSEAHTISMFKGPILEINLINGGLFKIKTNIENIGYPDATDVNWSIKLDGGAFIGKETTGTDDIPTDGEITVTSNLILGLGPTTVTVTAEIPGESDTRKQTGFVFLFFIKVNPGG